MSIESTLLAYNGTTLPAASETVVIFSTVSAGMGAGVAQQAGYKKLALILDNSHAGTLNYYVGPKTTTASTGWVLTTQTSVAAGATTSAQGFEFLISSAPHFKLEFVNSTTTQTAFGVFPSLVDERAAS